VEDGAEDNGDFRFWESELLLTRGIDGFSEMDVFYPTGKISKRRPRERSDTRG
jgi:hypothetical protein